MGRGRKWVVLFTLAIAILILHSQLVLLNVILFFSKNDKAPVPTSLPPSDLWEMGYPTSGSTCVFTAPFNWKPGGLIVNGPCPEVPRYAVVTDRTVGVSRSLGMVEYTWHDLLERKPQWAKQRTPFTIHAPAEAQTFRMRLNASAEEELYLLQPELIGGPPLNRSKSSPSILVIALEATHRQSFLAHMPSTVKWLRAVHARHRAFTFTHFDQVGPNTAPVMTPLFAGVPWTIADETARVQTRIYAASDKNGVQPSDLILTRLKRLGWITAYTEVHCSLFGCNRGNGYDEYEAEMFSHRPPTVARDCNWWQKSSAEPCIGGRFPTDYSFGYLKELWKRHKGVRKFGYTHCVHGHPPGKENAISAIDNKLLLLITSILEHDPETVIIIMGDHRKPGGMPGVSLNLVIPEQAVKLIKWNERVLQGNQNKLLSHWDLHEVLLHLVGLRRKHDAQPGVLPVNPLVTSVPATRTCDEAGIPANLCSCTKWKHQKGKSKLSGAALDWVNAITAEFRESCGEWTVQSVKNMRTTDTSTSFELVMGQGEPPIRFLFFYNRDQLEFVTRLTPYAKYEECSPRGVSGKFCFCE